MGKIEGTYDRVKWEKTFCLQSSNREKKLPAKLLYMSAKTQPVAGNDSNNF